jgi:uncharacterized membrane protein YgcG
MNCKPGIFTIACLLLAFNSISQNFTVSGRVADQRDTTPVIGATVQLLQTGDSAVKTGAVADIDGNFRIDNTAPGTYVLRISYLGYEPLQRTVNVISGDVDLGMIRMRPGNNLLGNVVVEGQQVRAQQMGDTTQFNANAFKTNPDANAEDLVTKMPGVTSDNNGVKVNGESVQQILVDGKPFFGDDPAVALKNLPAEVIDKIQVFDKLSDQAQFTGFDDGQSQKAINIITKRGKNNGQFGKIYGGYGTDDRYSAGGNINFFNGDRRISVIGLANNINQQNFSSEDLLGVSSGSSGGSGRGGYGGGGGRGGGGFSGGGGFQGGGGSAASNFLVGQQNGITTTNSIGLNYSDNWGKKIRVTGSYFFNQTDNKNETDLLRNYFTGPDSNLVYKENSNSETKNYNHRFNFRFEYNIDSANALIITPKLSFQDNRSNSYLLGSNTIGNATFAGMTNNNNQAHTNGYSFSNNLLFRHKFAKRGRTLSLNIGTSLNEKTGDGKIYSYNKYADDSTDVRDQEYDLYNNGYTLSGNLTYTEPVGKKGQLMVNYSPSYTKSKSDKEMYSMDGTAYTDLDTLLSNKYDNTYITQRGGLSYRLTDRKYNFMAGANIQYATLDGQQYFPYSFSLQRNFTNVLPQAMFNYRFNQGTNLRIMYRTATNAPSITQLQNVVDISNTLLLRTGNPALKQDYEHTLIVRYGKTQASKAHSLFVFLYGNMAQDYIANATYIPTQDSMVNGYLVRRGAQISLPVNLNGYYNTRAFVTYGMPVNPIKSNLNLNAGVTYSRTPALINSQENFSNNYALNGGLVLSSNVSENLDFTLAYNGNYNIAKNTLQKQSDNTYYSHIASFKINWIFLKGFVVNTSLNETMYSGLSQNFNQQFLLWNAYVGYKFLKDRSLEARVSAYDILNQNKSISRTFTDTYIEDSRTRVLTQYFMFTLTYTLRNFKGSASMPAADPGRLRGDMPGGMPPGGRFRDQGSN